MGTLGKGSCLCKDPPEFQQYRPCNATELRMFIGCINYHRDIWPSHAHVLKLLTDQSGLKKKAPIKWIDEMQNGFDKMFIFMAADALAASPDHNKRFDVYTNASDFQLGTFIIQEERPVSYFSQKLTKSQQNYTTMEKGMLSMSQLSKNLKSMLLGANIHVFTDYKNLTFDTLKMQNLIHWHTKIEEFLPILHYIQIQGPSIILANNLSRFSCLVTLAQIAEE